MIFLTFLDPNVFNLLKYIVMTVTVSLAADELLHTLQEYATSRKLSKRGWAYPSNATSRIRFKRGVFHRRLSANIVIISTIAIVSALEMALELSTGAESVWMEKTVTLRLANEAHNLTALLQGHPNYILKIREALMRVENTCYSVSDEWYHPITLNMSSTNEFHALGQGAFCFSNYTEQRSIRDEVKKSSFPASEIVNTNIWNVSELRAGRDVDREDVTTPLNETKNVTIGASGDNIYSFLAVNFSREGRVEGSEQRLTNYSDYIKAPSAFYTADYELENGNKLECLVVARNRTNDEGELERTFFIEVCMIPISNNRTVLGLFDDIEGDPEGGFQLVMSIALDGISTFHDMRVIPVLPLFVGKNNGMHTYRELGVISIISSKMISRVNMDGFRDEAFVVGDRSITAPTLSEWGVGLFAFGIVMIVVSKIWITRLKLSGWRNLQTVKGVAEQWLRTNEEAAGLYGEKGRVIFVRERGGDDQRTLFVNVRREFSSRDNSEPSEEGEVV